MNAIFPRNLQALVLCLKEGRGGVDTVGGQAFSLILAVRSHSREQNHLIQRNWKLILSQPPEFITKDHHISVIGK